MQMKEKQTDSSNVKGIISQFEETSRPTKHHRADWKPKCEPLLKLLRSRFIGFLMGPIFALAIYYYITYLILSPVSTPIPAEADVSSQLYDAVDIDPNLDTAYDVTTPDPAGQNQTHTETKLSSHIIGGAIGGGTGVLLAVGGAFSRRIRCTVVLVIPSLFARRGRAFMLTAAAGLLLSGPVATIDRNIQEVVNSLTCLYEQVKTVAEQYVEQFTKLWRDIKQILSQVNELIIQYKEELARLAAEATDEARQRAEEAQRDIERKLEDLRGSLSDLKDVLEAPGNFLEDVCGTGDSALSWVGGAAEDTGDFLSDVGSAIGGIFGRRKKRSACDIPPVVPKVDIGVPDPNLDALTDFLQQLNPDVNLIDLDWEGLTSQLEHNSIADIRRKLTVILKSVFELVQYYSGYARKLFYLSIVLVIWDALRYVHHFYADDSFDNMFADDNLRRLWKAGDKEKLLPLRRWELAEKYQNTTALKLSKAEAKRILITSIPTLLFMLIVAGCFAVDFGLASVLQVFKDEAQFGISFDGMEQGISFESLLPGLQTGDVDITGINLQGFDLSTEPCLPNPYFTDQKQTGIIVALVLVCLLSCIFDAYASRLRARICNLYFPDRAKERAEYLYKRIQTGRATRRIQLNMMVCRELDIRQRSSEFWFCCRLGKKKQGKKTGGSSSCPGCHVKTDKQERKPFTVTRHGEQTQTWICSDCQEDVKK